MLRIIVSTLLVCTIFSGCLAAPLTGSEDQEPFSLLVSVSLSLASFLCMVLAVVGCACCCGKTSILKYEESVEYDERHNTNQSHTNDAFADFSPPTQSTPSFPPGGVSETVSIEALPDLSSRLQTSHGLPQVSTALNDTGQQDGDLKHLKSPRFVFPRDQLNYVDELGNGWFGKVLQGEAHRLHPGMRKTRVVIKQLRDTASPEEQLLFLQEVQPYREVNHPNVLMLLGQCIESIPLLLVLEYAPYGDLKNYLRKNRGMVAEMAQKDVQLRMAHDIISGLLWLHQADFVHIDLAARNCQVCSDTSVKIGDYGLALEKYPEDYYITKDECHAVPIRWLGPEVIEIRGQDIKPKKITKQSNIWSFGVIMLELSTAADRPYPNLSDEQVLKQVVMDQDIKLDKPKLDLKYADRWFEIMMFCWMDGDTRPTVKEVHELLTHLKKNVDRVQMEDFETKWNALKPAVANQSSSECSEASQETPQQDLSVEIGRGDPLSIGMPKGDPLSSVSDVSQKQAQQTVSVDVTVPSLGQTGQEDQLIEDLAKGAKKSQPFEVTFDEPEEPAPRNVQETETVSELIPSIATPQANTAPPAGGNMSHELSFEDAFDTPTPTPQGDKQSSSQSFGLDDSVQNVDVTPKTPDFFSSEEVNPVEASTPFPPTQELNMQVSIDTSLSTGGYDTAVSNLLEANDSTVTFTESFNTMSSNPFSSGTSSSEPGGFVSAVESAGDKSLEDSQDYGNNGFGEFESSMLSYGTPSEGGMSSVLETPTPGGRDKGSSDLFGDLSQPSNPFDSSSASVSFGVNVDSPAVKDISFEQMAQNGEEKKDLQSFGAIRLTEHEKDSTDTPPVAEHDMTPQGYAEVSTAAKKPFSMTMLTVTSGKKKKSIEIHKEDDEDEDGKDAGDAASRVTVMTNGSSKMAKDEVVSPAAPPDSSAGTNLLDFDISGSGLDQGPGLAPGLTAGFGTIELQVSKDGEEAVVVPPQSPESLVEFGSFEDVSKES
nr:receptor tyrosine-protein kinase erbB-3-like [Lytechinus pictus]